MKWGYHHGYSDGCRDAANAARAESLTDFERTLSILREEMSDLRRDRDNQLARADAAADLLLSHLGTRAISLAGKQEEVERSERHVRTVQTLSSLPDALDELPIGHPAGLYQSKAEASLFGDIAEDVATAEG